MYLRCPPTGRQCATTCSVFYFSIATRYHCMTIIAAVEELRWVNLRTVPSDIYLECTAEAIPVLC